ncbi:MAG TPA: penicillin-binding transpeptidase domain-containing protein [Opitutaceae bacterium]|nr:penicillin-binding transpeptidase domain-containing protein [Opitutaceae bacterium]
MSVIETHASRNPRLLAIYALLAAMLVLLAGGLAYRQLFKSGLYAERERLQSQRRVIVPGPRGNIYDREGRVLVGNRPRFSVVLNLAELRDEFDNEARRIRANFRPYPPEERPSLAQRYRMARVAVVQRYLDQVNALIGRQERIADAAIDRHYRQSLLLPFILLDDLKPEEYARLIERLPVTSPLQVYTSSVRHYPNGAAAAHVLGYVGVTDEIEPENFPGEDLTTFKMRGHFGRDGLERTFDDLLEGQAGGQIYLVDHAGFKFAQAEDGRRPVQGGNLTTTLDLDLQQAAEAAMEGKVGAAVALDVHTGEVLVLASKPDYDLSLFVPRLSADAAREIEATGAWLNRAIQGQYPPGSTFKIVTAIAGLRAGAVDREESKTICPGYFMVGARRFPCWRRSGHGERDLAGALRDSCNVFFYRYGLDLGINFLAAEARRHGFDEPTGIELPNEFRTPHVASPEWKRKLFNESWYDGDTANVAIGQGDTLITPLHAACMIASFARGQSTTRPTLVHVAGRAPQRTAPLGLAPPDRAAVMEGLAQCYQIGTARLAKVEGLTAGAKTGTAQKGRIELAWTVAFAPFENPQIAVAVVMEGQEIDADYGGGAHAAPVVRAILETWKAKREGTALPALNIATFP